jgi:hypothetical protein
MGSCIRERPAPGCTLEPAGMSTPGAPDMCMYSVAAAEHEAATFPWPLQSTPIHWKIDRPSRTAEDMGR